MAGHHITHKVSVTVRGELDEAAGRVVVVYQRLQTLTW